jgi:hypothetical protein
MRTQEEVETRALQLEQELRRLGVQSLLAGDRRDWDACEDAGELAENARVRLALIAAFELPCWAVGSRAGGVTKWQRTGGLGRRSPSAR